jgi:hypothetical protein
MKARVFKALAILSSTIVHLAVLAIILNFWLPIAKWYWEQIPAKGIDLFNSVSYVSYLSKYFSLPVSSWKYTWFAGEPLTRDYPSLYFYLMLPFTRYFGIVRGVQFFALVANFAFIAFSYLLFARLAKNRVLAAILALSVTYSVNIYRALVYAGGIPFFVTQAMFPLVLFLVVKFIQSANRRYLVLAALVSGIGVIGHPQSFVNFIFPSVFFLLTFSCLKNSGFSLKKNLKNLTIYGIIAFLVGLPGFYYLLFSDFFVRVANLFDINLLGITPPEPPEPPLPEVVAWARNQFWVTFSEMNQALIHLLLLFGFFFILGVIISRLRKKAIINTLSAGLVCFWVIFYIYLLSVGVNLYHGGREAWYKLFWAAPIGIGVLASQFWGVFATSFSERIRAAKAKIITPIILEVISGAAFAFLAAFFFSSYTQGTIEKIARISVFSSTFPEAVGARLTPKGQARVAQEAKPSFLEDKSGDYRLYCNDQTVNLWWNSQFATPLARGYIDPPLVLKDRWGFFWMDAVFGVGSEGGTSLGDDWHTPEEVVEKNIAFLIDWQAIGFLEGNHQGFGGRGGFPPLSTSEKFIEKEEEREIQGAVLRRYIADPTKGDWDEDIIQKMHFYQIKSSLVSPIHQATNAPAILLIGGGDGYDIVNRFLGMMNLNSQKIIVAQGPQFLDKVSFVQMLDFDAIILYKYDYNNHSKAWGQIAKYLEKGGRVFIDTGAEGKESSSVELPARFGEALPELFPIKQTKRDDLGRAWVKEIGDPELFKDVKTERFSSFKFDDEPWNISYPPGKKDDLQEGAKVLLYSHGYPVLVEQDFGKGKIIWSGINLPYHVLYNYNFEEGKLLVNIFRRLVGLGGEQEASWQLNWVSPQKRIISSQGAKGVLLKEQAFPGWHSSVKGEKAGSKLTIYRVGPLSPGFMYVRIPEKLRNEEFEVVFSYRGSFTDWLITFVSLITIVLVADFVFLGGRFTNFCFIPVWSRVQKKMGTWWEKDEYE